MKHFRFFATLFVCFAGWIAAEAKSEIIVSYANQGDVKFEVADSLNVKSEGGSFTITEGDNGFCLRVHDVTNMRYLESSETENNEETAGMLVFAWDGKSLVVTGLAADEVCHVTSGTGHSLLNIPASEGVDIPLRAFPQGEYIVKIGDRQTVKFSR